MPLKKSFPTIKFFIILLFLIGAVYLLQAHTHVTAATPCPLKSQGDADCKKDSLGLDISLVDFNIWRSEKYGTGGCTAVNPVGCGVDEDSDGNSMDANFNYTSSGNLPVQPDPIIDSIDFNIWRTGYFAHKNPTATPSATPTQTITKGANTPTPTKTATPPPTGQIWKPTADKPIQLHWQLSTDFNPATDFVPGATVYDFDGEHASRTDVDAVHAKGFIAICYIDVGVFETYRNDAGKFPGSSKFSDPNTGQPIVYTGDSQYANTKVIGSADTGWAGSYWLDIRQLAVLKPIMTARFQMCKDKGFDAIEPDEQNGFDNSSGFPLTSQDQLVYNKWIADTVHSMGMSVGLKSDQAQAQDLINWYDWNLTEECYQYNECDQLAPFKQANKATWIVEYAANPNCTHANSNHYNAIKRDLDLVGPKDSGYQRTTCMPDNSTSWP